MAVARIKFSRLGPVRYLGHLDMLRYFQKVVMRSGISAKYSEGFHPHQLMSFAYPLGVGMETKGDYFDLEISGDETAAEIKERMNAVMNEGMKVVDCAILPEGETAAMAAVAAADYLLEYEGAGSADLAEAVEGFLKQEEILINEGEEEAEHKGKKKKKAPKDIRPGIMELRPEDKAIFMKLKSGSAMNVRPADVFDKLAGYAGAKDSLSILRLIRLEIYKDAGGYIPLIG
ncbi:MAG: TIGR03936 family radical SAM-associated protein [Lachnospiraceae bacterium]|nr:TIGR03936 family radical SAM-associated protein [Lachnospiraceae bacterium]